MPRIPAIVLVALASACRQLPGSFGPLADMSGTLLAPARPGRGSQSLVADLPLLVPGETAGSGIVGNNAAGLRGLASLPGATSSLVPVGSAPVLVLDGTGRPLAGTGGFTGGDGAFLLRQVPAGRTVLVSTVYAIGRERQVQLAVAVPEPGTPPVTLDPAMSAASARALANAGGRLEAVDPPGVRDAAAAIRAAGTLFSAEDLGDLATLTRAFQRAASGSPEVAAADPLPVRRPPAHEPPSAGLGLTASPSGIPVPPSEPPAAAPGPLPSGPEPRPADSEPPTPVSEPSALIPGSGVPEASAGAPALATPAPASTPGVEVLVPLPDYPRSAGGKEGAGAFPDLDAFEAGPATALDGLLDATAVAAGDRLVVVGGRAGDAAAADGGVYVSAVASDGRLAPFERQAELFIPVARPALRDTGRYLYVIGGETAAGPTAAVQRGEWTPVGLGPFALVARLHVEMNEPTVAATASTLVAVSAAGVAAFDLLPDGSLGPPRGLALRSDGRGAALAAFCGPRLFLAAGRGGTPADVLAADVALPLTRLLFHRWPGVAGAPFDGSAVLDGAVAWFTGGQGATPEGADRVFAMAFGSQGPTDMAPVAPRMAGPRLRHASAVVRRHLFVIGGSRSYPPERARIR